MYQILSSLPQSPKNRAPKTKKHSQHQPCSPPGSSATSAPYSGGVAASSNPGRGGKPLQQQQHAREAGYVVIKHGGMGNETSREVLADLLILVPVFPQPCTEREIQCQALESGKQLCSCTDL